MTGEASLARMLGQARVLRSGFAATAPQPWDGTTAAAELAVQLGHLAQCLGRGHGLDLSMFEDPARPITDTGDELADVTLAVLSIAVLSGGEPAVLPAAARGPHGTGSAMVEDVALLLALVISAGRLAESARSPRPARHESTGGFRWLPAARGAAPTGMSCVSGSRLRLTGQAPSALAAVRWPAGSDDRLQPRGA
jgi:hypothetical protein